MPKYKRQATLKRERVTIYTLVWEFHATKGWPIEWMCKILNVSRAAYYKWLHRDPNPKELENEEVLKAILEVSTELHNLYGPTR